MNNTVFIGAAVEGGVDIGTEGTIPTNGMERCGRVTSALVAVAGSIVVAMVIVVIGTLLVVDASDAARVCSCLLYTSDAADEEESVDIGGRRIHEKNREQ
eukprot:TRINITY_DN32670_c0_g1_i2.p2 TRINITY_DN32670_c0_g1~~TRINITY_DN32670_c0_g1_i2.p2  ORF type:complete len:100 (+),score=13.88 TRINITY_DN32670_c0_g1_i2:234-533(+)